MNFWKKSHGLTMPDGWFLKHCKTQHATSTREQPGRSHADTKSLSNPGSASSSQHTMVALSHMDSFVQGQQVRQSKQANVMAVPQAVCKQKSEARQQHVLSYHKANYGFKGRSKRQELLWLRVSCILPTPGPWWQWQLQLHVGNTWWHIQAGEAVATSLPHQLSTLSRFWHLQCTDWQVLSSGLSPAI